MQATSRPTSPTKLPPLSSPKATTTLWTARLVATLWKLAVKRARKLRRQSMGSPDTMYGSVMDAPSPTSEDHPLELDDASIMREAAHAVVASGVVSLADFEAVTGFRLSKDAASTTKDDDTNSEAATDTSDSCSFVESDDSHTTETVSPRARMITQLERSNRRAATTKRAKWVCVGYGRYEKVQE